ncbi:Uncharacterized protein CLAVI_000627 [Candidatus Clavichlamydia salmonicola]|uniref:ABC transporter permease n=1 Tax=Candidatus Clavichlamydia salmonicola TaxID=469812 RepID=UPI001891A70A|nr:ABC transporter permease [Candidatus Clavichlamydia salmonicola]MBF5051003.1 Uncharacterized protein [Candidatus Clavichlamydia salmonicola]
MSDENEEDAKLPRGFFSNLWKSFKLQKIRLLGVWLFITLCIIGIYAPIFASSQPLVIKWQGKFFFPWFRYLFYTGFYTKPVDLFFNLFMFVLLIGIVSSFLINRKMWKWLIIASVVVQFLGFSIISKGIIKDPARSNPHLRFAKAEYDHKEFTDFQMTQEALFPRKGLWDFELKHMTQYEKLQILVRRQNKLLQHQKIQKYVAVRPDLDIDLMPTLWNTEKRNEADRLQRLQEEKQQLESSYQHVSKIWGELLINYLPVAQKLKSLDEQLSIITNSIEYKKIQLSIEEYKKTNKAVIDAFQEAQKIKENYQKISDSFTMIKDRNAWIDQELRQVSFTLRPLLSNFHWEEDAGGSQSFNKVVPWWNLTRINRKSLLPGLIFGVRVALIVGVSTICIALMIGVPLGLISGYFSGRTDLIIFRFIEIWDTMPVFFMLLMLIAFCQNKSLFISIMVIGVFGWTGIARFIRAEALKQRMWPYVLASRSLGYSNFRIMISQVLPNAMIPTIAMLPFMIMTKIGTENTLSFLGLGEERSSSWGVLMHEAISVFPGESYLLWPPSIVLTIFLACIALIGDGLQEAYDPKSKN